jgi:hypothetical protein
LPKTEGYSILGITILFFLCAFVLKKGFAMQEDRRLICVMMFLFTTICLAETHRNLQAVDGDGVGTHPDLQTENKVTVEGIMLNDPLYILVATPDENAPSGPGGMWQIYIQGEGTDHAGTAIWMGQCYDNLWGGNGTYTNAQWLAELYRVNHDPCSGYDFAPGDRVRVTGLLKYYGGKTNINERHDTDPANDFKIELLEAAVGLPEPELITLNDVKDGNDNFIFVQSRDSGCEYYQGRLVRINNVSFVDANGWDKNATLKITNGVKTFDVKLGIGYGIYPGSNNLNDVFDVIGIFNQEDFDMAGYQIWVQNYDGNGKVLTDRRPKPWNIAGDVSNDGIVNFKDLADMAADWLKCAPGSGGCN